VVSNFAQWFIGILGRQSPIMGNFAAPEAQNRPASWKKSLQYEGPVNIMLEMHHLWNIVRRVDVGWHVWI